MLNAFFHIEIFLKRTLLCIAFAGVLSACGPGGQSRTETRQGVQTDGSLKQGNKKSGNKCFRVVNGTETTAYPAVVLILLKTGDQVTSTCSGFFVGKRTLLTASHCAANRYDSFAFINVTQFDRGDISSIPEGIEPKEVIAPVIVEDAAQAKERSFDVAVMVFDRNVAPAVLKIAGKTPAVGSKATVVGFGQTAVKPDGKPDQILRKRFGENVIGTVGNGILSFVGPMAGTDLPAKNGESGAAPGDSGGPLLVNGEVVGVVSGGSGQPTSQTINNIFADVNFSHSKELLEAAKDAGGDVGESSSNDKSDDLPDEDDSEDDEDCV